MRWVISLASQIRGSLASKFDYEPYGQTASSAADSYPFAFTGRVPINASVLYFRNRYYDSSAGAFLSEDPTRLAAGTQTMYRYVFNSPLDLSDPSGQSVFGSIVGGGLIILSFFAAPEEAALIAGTAASF